jgi:hypothetical protein
MSKISHTAMRGYFQADFRFARDFGARYEGKQLVETASSHGVFLQMDFLGAPPLRDSFVTFMDENDSDLCVSYGDIAAIYNAMYRPDPRTRREEQLNHWHDALSWLAFDRHEFVTQEIFAERKQVTVRTVNTWVNQAIAYVIAQLQGPQPGQVIIFPATYEPALAPIAAV